MNEKEEQLRRHGVSWRVRGNDDVGEACACGSKHADSNRMVVMEVRIRVHSWNKSVSIGYGLYFGFVLFSRDRGIDPMSASCIGKGGGLVATPDQIEIDLCEGIRIRFCQGLPPSCTLLPYCTSPSVSLYCTPYFPFGAEKSLIIHPCCSQLPLHPHICKPDF
jgi:hypothetical protein